MLTEERKQEILTDSWFAKTGLSDLQIWLEANEPEDKMLWKKSWWHRNCFIRDRLLKKLFGTDYKIVGEHYSKSILLPVVLVKYKDVEIILQYNFYDWQVMINSKKALQLANLDLYDADGDYFYYQGIPQKYCYKKYSADNNKQFAVDISDRSDDQLFDVYAFMLMLKEAIDKVN